MPIKRKSTIVDIAEFRARISRGHKPGVAVRLLGPGPQLETETETRTIAFIFSDDSIDRYGDRIEARGWQLDNFNANPVALFGHDSGSVENVIGRAKNVRIDGNRLVGDIEFMEGSVNPNAEVVYQMVKAGYLRAVSVGFQPLDWVAAKEKGRAGGIDFRKQELMEISIVPIPANPNALNLAKAAGIAVERLGPLLRYNEDQPRDDHGRFGFSGTPGNRAIRDKLDELGPVGRLLTAAHVGHVQAGVSGAVLGATLSAFVDSGAAKHVGFVSTVWYGYKILPKWAATLLYNLMGFASEPPPPRNAGKSVRHQRDGTVPNPTDEQLLEFFMQLSDDDAKRLANEILKELSQAQKKDVLNFLLETEESEDKCFTDSRLRTLPIATKGLYEVSWLAGLLAELAYLEDCVEWEADYEGDGSDVPAKLAQAMAALGAVLIEMTAEEVTELLAAEHDEDPVIVSSDPIDMAALTPAQKALIKLAALGRRARERQVRTLPPPVLPVETRAGKVLSAANESTLRDAHDLMTKGCTMVKSVFDQTATETDPEPDPDDAETKAARARRERLARAHGHLARVV